MSSASKWGLVCSGINVLKGFRSEGVRHDEAMIKVLPAKPVVKTCLGTLLLTWISNHMPSKMSDQIT